MIKQVMGGVLLLSMATLVQAHCEEDGPKALSAPEQAQLELACGRWADQEAVELSERGAFVSSCLASLRQELEETGAVEI